MSAPPREKEGFRRRKWEESLGTGTDTSSDLTLSYLAGAMTVNTGILESGSVTDTHTSNSTYVQVAGVPGAEEARVTFDIPRAPDFNALVIYGRHNSSGTITVEAYNNNTTTWDSLGTMTDSLTDAWYTYAITDSAPYRTGINGVKVRLRGEP